MKEAALAQNQKVVVGGVKFFLGGDKEREELEDESSEEEDIDMNALRHQMGINKKTKKRSKDLKKAASTVKKVFINFSIWASKANPDHRKRKRRANRTLSTSPRFICFMIRRGLRNNCSRSTYKAQNRT
jgi:SDA1-like protein